MIRGTCVLGEPLTKIERTWLLKHAHANLCCERVSDLQRVTVLRDGGSYDRLLYWFKDSAPFRWPTPMQFVKAKTDKQHMAAAVRASWAFGKSVEASDAYNAVSKYGNRRTWEGPDIVCPVCHKTPDAIGWTYAACCERIFAW